MKEILSISGWGNSSPAEVLVFSESGNSTRQIGGRLRRESFGSTNLVSQGQQNRVIRIANKIFALHASTTSTGRIYEFNSSASAANITYDSGSSLLSVGDTITGSSSGATATVADSSISGDDFIVVTGISGSFQIGEPFSGPSGVSGTIDSSFIQGGTPGSQGEWSVAYSLTGTFAAVTSFTGFFAMNIGGVTGVAGWYRTGSSSNALEYDVDTDAWIEYTSLGNPLADPIFSFKSNDVIYTLNDFRVVIYNPSTQSLSVISGTGANADVGLTLNGDVYFIAPGDVAPMVYYRLTGTTLTSSLSLSMTGNRASYTTPPMTDNDDSFFHFTNDFFTVNLTGYCITKNADLSLSCSNYPTGGSASSDQLRQLFIRVFGVGETSSPGINPCFSHLDLSDISAPVYNMQIADRRVTSPGTSFGLFDWQIYESVSDQPGVTYVWDGTTSVVYSPTTSTVLEAGDFIALEGSSPLYYFRVISASGGTITLDNPNSLTIPSGAGTTRRVKPSENLGNSARATSIKSQGSAGDGNYQWNTTGLDIVITGVSSALGGESLSFKCYSASGSDSCDVSFYFGPSGDMFPDTLCSLSSASAGTIVSNVITGLTADNSTTYTVTWLSESQGATTGERRRVMPRIEPA